MAVSCTHSSVNITKTPPAITNQVLNESTSSVRLIDAHTHWFFHCLCQFFYDLEKHSVVNNVHTVTLKITGVDVKLSLPITVCLPRQANKSLIDHENAHVRICLNTYDRADEIARRLSEGVIGKQFEGSGPTIDAACRQAIESASQIVTVHYRDETVKAAQGISDIFDELQAQSGGDVDKDMQRAIEQYRDRKAREKPPAAKIII
jgi:hypothetical protein